MLIPEDKKRPYPSLSPGYDDSTERIIMDAWVRFAAATISVGMVSVKDACVFADDLTAEFKRRFIKS